MVDAAALNHSLQKPSGPVTCPSDAAATGLALKSWKTSDNWEIFNSPSTSLGHRFGICFRKGGFENRNLGSCPKKGRCQSCKTKSYSLPNKERKDYIVRRCIVCFKDPKKRKRASKSLRTMIEFSKKKFGSPAYSLLYLFNEASLDLWLKQLGRLTTQRETVVRWRTKEKRNCGRGPSFYSC